MPILPVPEIGQWSQTASRFRADCGPDCVAMLLAYYGKLGGLTVNDLARETPLAQGSGGLYPIQLVVLAARHGLPLKVNANTTLEQIRSEIDAGRPVIALVAYRYILGRLDQADRVPGKDGHFLVILGYDDTHVIANDPDSWVDYETFGHNDLIPISELEQAIAGAAYYGQCLFVGDISMTTKEQIKALLAQAEALLDTIDETPSAPPQPITRYAIVDGLNIRGGPGTSYPILRKLSLGDEVTVTAVNGQWATITGPVSGYVFNQSLSDSPPK